MIPINAKYILVRVDSRTREKTVIFQSDDRVEIQQMKGVIESQIELTDFIHFKYSIEESMVDVMRN